MRVWLRDTATKDQVSSIAKQIRGIDGVKEARWIPKEIEWKKQRLENPDATEGLENPFPHSLKVILVHLSDAGQVAAKIQGIPLVEKNGVRYLKDEQEFMDQMLRLLRWLGGGLGALLLVTAGILIYNAIRLTILARRREIRIMELVGASHFTVRMPFVIEGMIQGAVGGMFASLLILAAQSAIEQQMKTFLATASLPPFPIWTAMLALAVLGGLFGVVCSTLALREPLRLRIGGAM
jgi:cell division transport system permease protein